MISFFSLLCSSSLSNIHESLNTYARECSAKKVHQVHPVFFSTRECPILLASPSLLILGPENTHNAISWDHFRLLLPALHCFQFC